MTSPAVKEIQIAHSPDSDDAFMFYGLAKDKVRDLADDASDKAQDAYGQAKGKLQDAAGTAGDRDCLRGHRAPPRRPIACRDH